MNGTATRLSANEWKKARRFGEKYWLYVVTGAATGAAVDPERLRRTVEGAGGRPVFAGSGTTPDAVPELYAAGARGAIVGTWCKADGAIESPADPARAGRLVAARDRLEVP